MSLSSVCCVRSLCTCIKKIQKKKEKKNNNKFHKIQNFLYFPNEILNENE